MRTVTFADPKLLELVDTRYVPVWHNQNAQEENNLSGQLQTYSSRQPLQQATVNAYPEGAGGTNMIVLVCDPNGSVLHYLEGYWGAGQLIDELNYVQKQYAAARSTKAYEFGFMREQLLARQQALQAEQLEIGKALTAAGKANAPVRESRERQRQARLGLLVVSYANGQQYMGTDVGQFLNQTLLWNLQKGAFI